MRGRSLAVALVSALALGGCGSHPATRADVVARGNAICASANAEIRAVPSPRTSADLPGYFSRVAPIVAREATTLRALPRPAADRSLLDAFLAAQARIATTYGQLASAARSGDETGAQAALQSLGANPAGGLASRYGLSQCTGTAATVR